MLITKGGLVMKNNKIFKGVLSICLVASISAISYSIKKSNEEQSNIYEPNYLYSEETFEVSKESREKMMTIVMNEPSYGLEPELTYDDALEYFWGRPFQHLESILEKFYEGQKVLVFKNCDEVSGYFKLNGIDSYAYSIEDDLIWHLNRDGEIESIQNTHEAVSNYNKYCLSLNRKR